MNLKNNAIKLLSLEINAISGYSSKNISNLAEKGLF
jgi:hypothetical protein